MGLESVNNAHELNQNWPIDNSDPALQGAAHLRLLKNVLRRGYLGQMNQSQIDSWNFQQGQSFYHNNNFWIVIAKSAYQQPEDDEKWFSLSSVLGALALGRVNRVGAPGNIGFIITDSPQKRRPVVRFLGTQAGTPSDWPASLVNPLFPNGAPVSGDVAIVFSTTGYAMPRMYTSMWVPMQFVSVGNSAFTGVFASRELRALSGDFDRVRTARLERFSTDSVWVEDLEGFGPDNLVMWYGPKIAINIFNSGEIDYTTLGKTNAWRYMVKETGEVGPDPAP